jgi:hypothetical protein
VLAFGLGLAACSGGGAPVTPTPQCVVHLQCPRGQCQGGRCVNATLCADNNQCDRGTRCVAERCIPVCATDVECPAGYLCTMDGCVEFSDKVSRPAPVSRTAARTPLRAGVAEANLEVPVGVSQGGFAGRGGLYVEPYAETIFPSTGFFHRLRVKALALDTGNERVVVAAAPLIFITDWLRERVVRLLRDETGFDYREHLILTANHSHSGPARIWTIPFGFGSFGLDEHMKEIHERVASSFVRAIADAVAKLAPAKMGWSTDTAFDPQNKIRSSRRRTTPHGDDHRLFLMRVDDDAGVPLAAVVNFGIHGIIHEGPFLSSDSAGGIEHKVEEALETAHGRRVPVLFVQGNGGNMSPRCDDLGYPDVPRAQLCGSRTVPYVMALWDNVTRKADWDMRFALKRVPVSYKDIGYAPGEFFDRTPIGGYSPFTYGAFECIVFAAPEDLPATDGNLGCVLPIESTFRAPVQAFNKATLSLLKLDDLLISTQPGEPVMEYGYTVATGLKALGGVRDAVVFGYSQDHHLYLMHADEWFYGGTEGNTTVWGYRFGDYMARESISFAQEFVAGRPITSKVMPQDFPTVSSPPDVVPDTTSAADVGTIVQAIPDAIERGEQHVLRVVGGHPGAGSPDIVLQREMAGTFVDLASDGTPHAAMRTRYDNATYKFITDHVNDAGRHVWSFRWEELRDFPTGRFRFRLVLPYFTGTAKATKEAFSAAFSLSPMSKLIVSGASVSAAGVSLHASYPAGVQALVPRERFERDVSVDLDCDRTADATMEVREDYDPVGIRVREVGVGPVDPIAVRTPLTIIVTKDGGSPQTFAGVAAGADATVVHVVRSGRGPVTASTTRPELVGQTIDRVRCASIASPLYQVTSGFTFGGAGTYRVRVEDASGNFGEVTVVVP